MLQSPSPTPSHSAAPNPYLVRDDNDDLVLDVDSFFTHGSHTFAVCTLGLCQISKEGDIRPCNKSTVIGDFGISNRIPPNNIGHGMSVRIHGKDTPSGREITIFTASKSPAGAGIAAMTINQLSGMSELRWASSAAGPSTFLDLDGNSSAKSFPADMIAFTGADGYARVAITADHVSSPGNLRLVIVAFNSIHDTPYREAFVESRWLSFVSDGHTLATSDTGDLYAIEYNKDLTAEP